MSETPAYQRFFAELKRRHVFRVSAVYGATAFVVVQAADVLQEALKLPEAFLTAVAAFALLGFPIALVLAWAYERTPEGVKKTMPASPGEITEIVAAPAAKRWPIGLAAAGGTALLLVGAWLVLGRPSAGPTPTALDPAATAPDAGAAVGAEPSDRDAEVLQLAYADLSADTRPSIAVLPFADMSPEGDQEYFADGMTEELLNVLAKIRDLRVAGRTSAFAYKGQDKDLREIGRELGVRYILEGSVRKQGDRLRITAQLVDASDNFHLWSDSYDRTLDDVFAVQEEIAGAIADELQVSLGLEEDGVLVAPMADLGAYEMYLAARALMRERGPAVLEAVRMFEEVVARDSMWAPGWAGLAQAYSVVPFYMPGNRGHDILAERMAPSLDDAERAALRALALDPRVAGAEVALGNVFRDRWEWDEAEAHFLRALELDPDDVEAHQQYSEMLAGMGRLDEALRSSRRAVALDPTSAIRANVLGYILFLNARAEESIAQLELAIVHGADFPMPYDNLSRAHLYLGDLDEAERLEREEVIPRRGYDPGTEAAEDQSAEDRFEALRNRDVAAYERCCESEDAAGDYVLLGAPDRAIEAARNRWVGSAKVSSNFLNPLWGPTLDPLRDDPRFIEFLDEIRVYTGLQGVEFKRAPEGQ